MTHRENPNRRELLQGAYGRYHHGKAGLKRLNNQMLAKTLKCSINVRKIESKRKKENKKTIFHLEEVQEILTGTHVLWTCPLSYVNKGGMAQRKI